MLFANSECCLGSLSCVLPVWLHSRDMLWKRAVWGTEILDTNFQRKKGKQGEGYFLVETNITDSQPQLFYWDDSYVRDRKAEGTMSLGSKDQIKPGSCTSVWSHGVKGTVKITHNYFPMWLHSGLSWAKQIKLYLGSLCPFLSLCLGQISFTEDLSAYLQCRALQKRY